MREDYARTTQGLRGAVAPDRYRAGSVMDFELDLSLKEWAKDKPLSILQLDPADRAVLRIAGELARAMWGDEPPGGPPRPGWAGVNTHVESSRGGSTCRSPWGRGGGYPVGRQHIYIITT